MSWETVYNCGSLDSDEDSFRRFILLNLVNVSAISSASSFFFFQLGICRPLSMGIHWSHDLVLIHIQH